MSTLPNPDIYLNHFPPALVVQFELGRNVALAVLGATTWDILIYIPDDIKILRRSPFHLVTVCFVASRLLALTSVLLAVIEFTHPVGNCRAFNYCLGIGSNLTILTTTFIFLQRLRAVYSENRLIQLIGILLWIGLCITTSFTTVDATSAHVPGTQYCVYSVLNRTLLINGAMFFGFDTFIFLAITYKIVSSHLHADIETGLKWRIAISGKSLPRVSQAIIQGGGKYYFLTLCIQIPDLLLTTIPSIPIHLRLVLTFPLICLSASMACRVFRNLQMSNPHDEFYPTVSNVHFGPSSRFQGSTISTIPCAHIGARSLHTATITFPQGNIPSQVLSPNDFWAAVTTLGYVRQQ